MITALAPAGYRSDHLAAQIVHRLAAAQAPPPSLPRRARTQLAPACCCDRLWT